MSNKCENSVRLMGFAVTQPEQIDDDPVGIRFKLATNENFFSKKKQEYVKNSEIHLVKSWKQSAEFSLNNVNVGDYLFIKGKLHYHHLTTEEGRKIKNPEVIATKITKLNRDNPRDDTENQEAEDE